MSINNATGSFTRETKDISQDLQATAAGVSGTIGGGGSGEIVVGDGGFAISTAGTAGVDFAGMKEGGIADFNSAIDTYRDGIQDIINEFNPNADMEKALKGQVAEAVHEFLESFKELLRKYVEAIDIEKKAINEAHKNWLTASGSIAGDIQSDSSDIRGKAGQLSID